MPSAKKGMTTIMQDGSMYEAMKKNATNTKTITAMGSGEATIIKLNNEKNHAEEDDNADNKDDERVQDNEGGAEDVGDT